MENIDVEKLTCDAEESCCNETFVLRDRASDYRIGVGAIIEDEDKKYFLEVAINICPSDSKFDIGSMEKRLELLKSLKKRGYEICCVDGLITCEKALEKTDINKEYDVVKGIIDKFGLK